MIRRSFISALLVLAVGSIQPAIADAVPRPLMREAMRRFEHANRLYTEGRYTDALHLYQAAYDLVPSADILFNIGLSKEKVFDYEGCAVDLQRYLAQSPHSARIDQAKQRLEACRARTRVPVQVTSLPGSAAVYLVAGTQRALGGRTPTHLALAPGSYTIAVEAPGYIPQTRQLTVEPGVHPDVDFSLEKLSSLHIEADVSGADVELDGQALGPTPVRRELRAGLYHVRLTKSGYQPIEREVRVQAGDQVSLMLSLTALPREHRLSLSVDRPLSATVHVDGDALGSTPIGRDLPAGTHHVEVSRPGFLAYRGEVDVPEDHDAALRVHLVPVRSRKQKLLFGGLLALSGAAALTGVGFGIVALHDQAVYDRTPTVDLHSRGSAHALAADLLLGSALAVAAGAVIYYVVTAPGHSRATVLK